MFGYYLHLALRTLRRNVILTSLIVAAVGVGIGAYMTVLTVLSPCRAIRFRTNPASCSCRKSMFGVRHPTPGAAPRDSLAGSVHLPGCGRSYAGACAARHQAAMYPSGSTCTPASGIPFSEPGRATYRDFFDMFQVPFKEGAAWSVQDETDRADVAVLGNKLAARLFPHLAAVGQHFDGSGDTHIGLSG